MTLEKYIKHFDEIFGTEVLKSMKERNYPMLDFAFNELGEKLYAQNSLNKDFSEKKIAIVNKIEKLNSDIQKQLLDEYEDLESELRADIEKQMLVFGFCICYEQLKEVGIIK